MARLPKTKELGATAAAPSVKPTPTTTTPAVKTPTKAFSKATGVPEVKPVAKPAYNRLANLGDFAHPAKRKKKA